MSLRLPLTNDAMPACSVDANNGGTGVYNLNANFFDANWRDSGSTRLFDRGSNFTPGSTSTDGRFVVPAGAAGVYLITGHIIWTGANMVAGALYRLSINAGGVRTDFTNICQVNGQGVVASGSYVAVLAAGDQVYARPLSTANHSVSTVTFSKDESWMTIAKLY